MKDTYKGSPPPFVHINSWVGQGVTFTYQMLPPPQIHYKKLGGAHVLEIPETKNRENYTQYEFFN